MFVRAKKNHLRTISEQDIEKSFDLYKKIKTIGSSSDKDWIKVFKAFSNATLHQV